MANYGNSFPVMSEDLQKVLQQSVLRVLRPLVRVLLNHGMAYGTLAELARKAFVEEGFDYVERSGKRPTVSSVSALTGLTRKETKRLREIDLLSDEESSARYNRAIRVISAWIADPRFHDSNGKPAILAVDQGESSFAALVKEYSGDIPPTAMFKVLEATKIVAAVDGGIELKQRAYLPSATPVEKLHILGTDVGELLETIGHNLEAEPTGRFFQRKVSNVSVDPRAVATFRDLSNRKSQELLEEYHHWLSHHQVDDGEDMESAYVAIGIYYIERSKQEP